MSRREFEAWSKKPLDNNDNNYGNVRIKGSSLFIGDSPVATFSQDISPEDRRYFESLLLEAGKAMEQNEVIGIFRFYDEDEKKRFDRIYQRELKAIRVKK